MATTARLDITDDAWTQVPLDGIYVAIQINETDRVKVHVADTPPADSDTTGLIVAHNSPGVPSSFAAGGLPDNVGVWVRTTKGPSKITYLTY
jgi:acyl-CoA synthetase (NDP forming)